MDEQMRLYWETVKENNPTDKLIRSTFNPVREFEDELIEGPILELGCGQSPYILDYCKTGREIFAVDNDEYQLQELESRVSEIESNSEVHYINATILEDELPHNIYSLIIMSNILHFFSMDDCSLLINQLMNFSTSGTIFFAVCHSTSHPHNDPNNPDNNEYFKHYFSEEDLNNLFDGENFERTFFADIKKINSQFDTSIVHKWLNKVFDKEGITNQKVREIEIQNYIGDNLEADLFCIYRRK